jgi:aromatic ring-cleaving dioxygenase
VTNIASNTLNGNAERMSQEDHVDRMDENMWLGKQSELQTYIINDMKETKGMLERGSEASTGM